MNGKTENRSRDLNLVRLFNAPVDKVWRAWTDEKLVQNWWGPKFFSNPTCEWDARPGGKINVVMLGADRAALGEYRNMKAPMGGEFQEVIEKKKIVFDSKALGEGGKVMLENLNSVAFEDAGNGRTKMSLDVVVLDVKPEMRKAVEGMGEGWSQSFDKLEALLPTVEP